MSNSQFAPPDSPMYDWSNPKRVGPGVWYMFMLMSRYAEDKAERAWICAQIRLFCDHFKCGDCSGHCKKYIEQHPPECSINSKYGLFHWVVTFMNAVNKRLGKPLYDENILFRIFDEPEFKFCSADCNASKTPAASHSRTESRSSVQPRLSKPAAQRGLQTGYTSVPVSSNNIRATRSGQTRSHAVVFNTSRN